MEQSQKKLMWLDCDPGHDDAMAIYMAARADNVQLLGISTVFGNNTLEKVTNNALRVLKMGGIENIPVYRGSERPIMRQLVTAESIHGDSGLDGCVLPETEQKAISEDALHKVYLLLRSQLPRKVHFVATGCLTNLALLLTTYPNVRETIEQISLMGGAVGIGNWFPASEFNIGIDPEASKVVFGCGLPVTMVPIELTHEVSVTEEIFKRINALNSEFSRNVSGLMNFFKHTYKEVFKLDLVPLHDPCAVYYVINPSAFETVMRNVEIETKSEFCDGRTVVDEYGCTGRPLNVNLAKKVNLESFWDEMISALIKCDQHSPVNVKQ